MALIAKGLSLLLMRCLAPLLGVVLAVWALLLLLRHCRSVSGKGIPPAQWVALSVVMVVCTLFSGKNTNGVQNVGGGNLFLFNPPPVQPVTPQDISNGWRVAEEMEAEAFAPPMPFAVTNELWRLRGAHDDSLRISADGWSYPFATGVTVLSRGELRTCMRAHDFPRAFEQDLSLLPLASWPLLPEGRRESFFWHGATPSNTLLATWRNAALGRDATNPVSFQAELFPDGGFTYRYEDRTVRHARVWPFDWYDDVLENSFDPDPLLAGPDAHGTNAEWYNAVCSNVLVAAEGPDGVSLSWREGVNSNAYYFVDVVAERGPAPICFTGDRTSALGDPVVVVRGGETNRVPLLIGIDYAVTSDVPFTVSFTDSGFATISTNGQYSAEVVWPLEFTFTEGFADGSRVYTVDVVPYDPGGVFSWELPRRGAACGCVSYSGRTIVMGCTSTCGCGGGCAATGAYMLESAIFAATGGICRCDFDDPDPPSEELPPGPGLSVSFSKGAVIYEDSYENSPGVWMPKRSTRVRLSVAASGGPHGGTLSLTSMNLTKLSAVGGSLALQSPIEIAADEGYSVSFLCEAAEQSIIEDDVIVSGVLTENDTGQVITNADTLTVFRVELQVQNQAPANTCVNRHRYGVGELVTCRQWPSSPSLNFTAKSDGCVSNTAPRKYVCPLHEESNGLTITYGGSLYRPQIWIIEPEGIQCVDCDFLQPTMMEGVGMQLELRVLPYDVSFKGIALQEVPCLQGTHTGYFAQSCYQQRWYHTVTWGAGVWRNVTDGNRWGWDASRMFQWEQPWSQGILTWEIPIGWNRAGTTSGACVKQKDLGADSTWDMSPYGITKIKYGQVLSLETDGSWSLNGEYYNGSQQ